MRRRVLGAILGAMLLAPAVFAQDRAQLFVKHDLDGEAANAAKIVTVATLADSTTFTIAAQPDVCRLVDMTVVDADSSITVGTVTVTGTSCLGDALVSVFTVTGGSGVKNGSPAAYFGNVTSAISSVLTGESGAPDTLTVGYSTSISKAWGMYGQLYTRTNGELVVNPFGRFAGPALVTTSGSPSTTLTGNPNPFAGVSVGDLLFIDNGATDPYERKVTARASSESVTLDSAINIPSAGAKWTYKKFYLSTNPTHRLWIDTRGWTSITAVFDNTSGTNTGGVISSWECTASPDFSYGVIEKDTLTVGSGTTGVDESALDLTLAAYPFCRFSLRFGTNDDADATGAATESADAVVLFNGRR